MKIFSRSMVGLCRRVGSTQPRPRRWPNGVVRRDAPLMDCLYRSWDMQGNTEVGNENKSKMQSHNPLPCGTTKCVDVDTEKMRKNATKRVTYNYPLMEKKWFPKIYKNSSHRDGAIYTNWLFKNEWPDVDITDRSEKDMLQFMSVMLADAPVSSGSTQLYGYIAVRDGRDWMLNYVFNHSRDDPITVQQGDLIGMMGPKRGIEMSPPVLIEFDVRIKNGELEEDDLELIDGAIACTLRKPWKPIKYHIAGNCGAVDMTLAFVRYAVEATIEVVISEAQIGVGLSLSSFVYIAMDFEEIQLFQGTTVQSFSQARYVVAVTSGTEMLLKFKVGNNNVERCLSFKAKQHGCDSQQMKLELATLSVKVTWSTI
ncbi:unnamed protein product [Urochloa decumbens]|uniref:DUF6598 domain-containing protein n=1 Tax=Urochloa decumbens TaxID=240449 RepID=A0ABC9AFC2_9POAL